MGRCRWLKDRCFTSSCASACTRAFLVVINFVFLASGWALLGLGVWLHICKDTYFFAVLLRDNPTNPMIVLDRVSLIMIAIGGFVIIISFLGCCGACTDSVCFLGFYAFLLVAAIVVQVSVATVAPAFRQKVLLELSRSMRYQVHYEYNATAKYTNFTNTELYRITSSWDILQIKLNCCGSNGPVDYKEGAWWNHTDFAAAQFVPQSCCTIFPADSRRMKFKDPNMCQVEAIKAMSDYPNITGDFTNVNTQGCHAALVDWLKQYEYLVGVFYIVIILQMVDFIYACILMSWLRKSLTDYSWCEEDEFQ